MTDAIPPEILTAAAVAIHDADCPDTHCSGAALGHAYRLAGAALKAAGPHIAAIERERIRQLAIDHDAAITGDCDCPGGHPGTRGRFAALLAGEK